MKGSESMSEATIAITKLRQDKLNPHYRPMIFVIAPFTEVVKSDAKSTMTVRALTAVLSINMVASPFVHSSTYLNLLTCIIRKNFK